MRARLQQPCGDVLQLDMDEDAAIHGQVWEVYMERDTRDMERVVRTIL